MAETIKYIDAPEILSANELATFLHISRAGAYNLLNSKDFPTLHVGGRKLVTKENVLLWMKKNTNKIAKFPAPLRLAPAAFILESNDPVKDSRGHQKYNLQKEIEIICQENGQMEKVPSTSGQTACGSGRLW